ncbi:HPr family phosphocarrier protein [Mycoplasmoides pirum]|uniref:HPr family phosphocarrier protein n=1 Tax=Mycoplasmoides pirum TaxID=2122 RepID=UPI000489576A|nr:HPr family phosphocarrier protein [Mycoplasmoides pirum]
MKSLKVTIQDPTGLHARPATLLVKTASSFKSTIQIKNPANAVGNMKSIINLLSLSIKQNDAIEIIVDGEDEDAAIEAIKQTLTENKLI